MTDLFDALTSAGETPSATPPSPEPAPTPTPDPVAASPAAPTATATAPAIAPEAPATPAVPSAPVPPAPPAQGQPAAPVIPPEYATAHEFYNRLTPIANRIGGLDHIENAVEWTSLMFGLGDTPQNYTPEQYFVEKFKQTDPQMYAAVAERIIEAQKPVILQAYRDEILQSIGIPTDKLQSVQDFLKYGAGAVGSEEEREFITELNNPELAKVFQGLTPAHRAHLLNNMPKEMAIDWLADKKVMLDIQSEKSQQSEQKTATEQRIMQAQTEALRESQISKAEEVFINAKAAELGLPKEQIQDWLTVVAVNMDREIAQLQQQLQQQYPHATQEQITQALMQKSDVARTWHQLEQACASRNELRINAAMNQFRLLTETRFANFLASRKQAPVNPTAPTVPAPGAPRDPQFQPGNPPANDSNSDLLGLLFGQTAPGQYA